MTAAAFAGIGLHLVMLELLGFWVGHNFGWGFEVGAVLSGWYWFRLYENRSLLFSIIEQQIDEAVNDFKEL